MLFNKNLFSYFDCHFILAYISCNLQASFLHNKILTKIFHLSLFNNTRVIIQKTLELIGLKLKIGFFWL